jgi:uncharacterized protein with PIN domain
MTYTKREELTKMPTDFFDVAIRDFDSREAERERRQRYCKRCYNCGEPIEQSEAVHIVLGNRNKPVEFWFCDDCVETLKEYTGYDEDEY